jgi:hypothetical protein
MTAAEGIKAPALYPVIDAPATSPADAL